MTPEAAGYLADAWESLSDGRKILTLGLTKVAARSAYYAAFHAAEALIYEASGKPVKTHRGVRTEFARLTRDRLVPSPSLTGLLARAYQYKEIADYGASRSTTVLAADAENLLASATEFVQWVEAILA